MAPRGLAQRNINKRQATSEAPESESQKKTKTEDVEDADADINDELTLSNVLELWNKSIVTGSTDTSAILKVAFGISSSLTEERSEEAQSMLRGILHACDAFDQYIENKDASKILSLELDGDDVKVVLKILEGFALVLLGTWPQVESGYIENEDEQVSAKAVASKKTSEESSSKSKPEELHDSIAFQTKGLQLLQEANSYINNNTTCDLQFWANIGLAIASIESDFTSAKEFYEKAGKLSDQIKESTVYLDAEVKDALVNTAAARILDHVPADDADAALAQTLKPPLDAMEKSVSSRASTKSKTSFNIAEIDYRVFSALANKVDISESDDEEVETDASGKVMSESETKETIINYNGIDPKELVDLGYKSRASLSAAIDSIGPFPLSDKTGISLDTYAKLGEVLASLSEFVEDEDSKNELSSEYEAILTKIYPEN